ncbi:PAS domain S-box protein, partial [Pyxidicoccus sp. 3LG]
MSTKRYSEADLRALIEPFGNPMLAVVEGRVCSVNEAWLALVGAPRERVEGLPVMDFVQPEERSRLSERYRLLESGAPLDPRTQIYQVPCADGTTREVALYATRLPLEGGAGALLLNCLPLMDGPPELALAERLVDTSAGLVSAHSEDAVRRVAMKGLAAAGFQVRLLHWDGEKLLARDGQPLPEDVGLGIEALSDGRPVFGGADRASPSHVYLPVGGPQAEVLW